MTYIQTSWIIITYLKRYSLSAILWIATDEETDWNTWWQSKEVQQQQKEKIVWFTPGQFQRAMKEPPENIEKILKKYQMKREYRDALIKQKNN